MSQPEYCFYDAPQDYEATWSKMRTFTENRDETTEDALWFLEHPPIFTQGQAGKAEHVLAPGSIPIVQTDRGGQVTYHGPGQLVVYVLLDTKRLGVNIRTLVHGLEASLIDLLASYDISGERRCKAPGVYVGEKKIASIGLRVRRGYTYHGLSLNVDMDLEPFSRINPCGYEKLAMTQLADFMAAPSLESISQKLYAALIKNLFSLTHKSS